MRQFGMPYKGSKSKIAKSILALFPQRDNLYDLFMGGGAITHCAMIGGKFKNIYSNDINWMCPRLFEDVLKGKYDNDDRWISREEFYELKDSDPYVAFVWSFGNNIRDYIYGADIEEWKKAYHYAVVLNDQSLMSALGFDVSYLSSYSTEGERYKALKRHFYWCNLWEDVAKKLGIGDGKFDGIKSLQNRSNHRKLLGVKVDNYRKNLFFSNKSYDEIEKKPNSVIYCDIPYKDTNVYDKVNGFDHERFYDWCMEQSEPLFISEYWMPEDRFDIVLEVTHSSLIAAQAHNRVVERVFVPKHQKKVGNIQLSLFDL